MATNPNPYEFSDDSSDSSDDDDDDGSSANSSSSSVNIFKFNFLNLLTFFFFL